MKSELKVEFGNTDILKELIETAYYENGQSGKLMGKKSLFVDDEVDDIFVTCVNGIDRSTIKVTNRELINGNIRFLLEQCDGGFNITPVSTYCISENDKYSFY